MERTIEETLRKELDLAQKTELFAKHTKDFMQMLHAANDENRVYIKEAKLQEARKKLLFLKQLQEDHAGVTLQNLPAVEQSMEAIQAELDNLKNTKRRSITSDIKTFFLNLGIYPLRILYGVFLCTAIVGSLVSVFSSDHENSVWFGLFVALFIYLIGHFLFLKPSRYLARMRDGIHPKQTHIMSGYGDNAHNSTDVFPRAHAEPKKTKNKTKGKWITPDDTITIGKKTITKGLFYFGGGLNGENYGETESSLVDESLPIKDAPYSFTDNSLGYWPSFEGLSPMCRGAYIDWLASDRDMPNTPIGYVFIYFYGMERRIIKDYKDGLVSDAECAKICKEILRLKSIFKDNYSFSSYSSSLLDYVSITHPSIFSLPDNEIEESIYSDVFRVKLARVAHNNEPLNPYLAHAWIKSHLDYSLRTPARRCPEEFKALFMQKYVEAYNDGMMVKPNKTKLRLNYRPASRSLNYFEYGPTGLCDPTVLTAPIKKLSDIATQCTDELDSYSRYLGKKDASKEDIGAIVLLPKSLIDEFEIPLIQNFREWAAHIVKNEDGICTFKNVWNHTKLAMPPKVNKKEHELICNLIEKAGYSLAPHPTVHGSKLTPDSLIIIYQEDGSSNMANTAVFDDIAIKLRLGAIIANADLKIHSNEITFLQKIIHSNDNLTSPEKASLEAYLKWLLNSPSNVNGLKASLKNLRDKETEFVRKMLIHVALSDGKIDPNEVREIEKLYTTLGLDKSTVPADIHAMSSSKIEFGSNISPEMGSTSKEKQSFRLDESVLDIHELETKAAQEILKQIFKDEDEVDGEENPETAVEPPIEDKALAIYKIISDREKIDRSEFERICSEHGFFVDAAIDSINEWALDKVNALVIESDIDIVIDREIADELKELEGAE